MMPDSFEIARFIIAFFTSGIFWLMILFYAEKRWRQHAVPGVSVAAAIVLAAAAILFFKVVVDDAPWRMPPGDDEMSYSSPARSGSVDAHVHGRVREGDRHLDD
jgi:hypothetical protein